MFVHLSGYYVLAQPQVKELRSESEDVKKRYFAIAKILMPYPIRLNRKRTGELIGLCKRQH